VENLNVKETKAKGKGTAKKDNVKSTKDIREEITQLLAVQKDGWILVDFPRNINQAKLIENHFNGYRS
jgi:adenylate kinase family enzyme